MVEIFFMWYEYNQNSPLGVVKKIKIKTDDKSVKSVI